MHLVDFHSHYVERLADAGALLAAVEESGISARVINMPLEFIRKAGGEIPPDTVARNNDTVADLVSRHPGRLYGLATVDAYGGDAAAEELIRAVTQLGLRGVFVESAQGDLLPDAKEARPTFAAAAALGVPVFLHPVPDAPLKRRFAGCGRLSERLVRSTINSAALLALLEAGMFEELPKLRVVVTALALGGVFLAGCFGDGARLRKDDPARRQVYIDTTGMHPVMIRGAVELLGADRVVMGTDWPVVKEPSLPQRLPALLATCGLDAAEQRMVAGGNALRLLGC